MRFSSLSHWMTLCGVSLFFLWGLGSCTSNPATTPNGTGEETAAESLASLISNAALSADGSLVALEQKPNPGFFQNVYHGLIHFEPNAFAASVCPSLSNSGCADGVSMVYYLGCTRTTASTPFWNGTAGQVGYESFTFNSQNSCQQVAQGNVNLSGATATRIYGGSIPGDNSVSVSYTNSNSTKLTVLLDTLTTTGTDSSVYKPVSGGQPGDAANASNAQPNGGFYHTYNCNGTASETCVDVSGINEIGYSAVDGTLVFNHTFSTLNGAPLIIHGSGNSRTVTSGTVFMQHNTAGYTAKATIATTLSGFTSNCCFPGAGKLSLTYTRGQSDSTAIDFGDCNQGGATATGCGAATITKTDGSKSCVTLVSCH